MPEGTPIEIQIFVDDLQPFRVKHDPIVVQCSFNLLNITLESCSKDALEKAIAAATAALDALPETPLTACGINIKYELVEPEPGILSAMKSGFDNAFSDLGMQISSRTVRVAIADPPGTINLEACHNDKGMTVSFNFHRASTDHGELRQWLNRPLAQVLETVEKLLVEGIKGPTAVEE